MRRQRYRGERERKEKLSLSSNTASVGARRQQRNKDGLPSVFSGCCQNKHHIGQIYSSTIVVPHVRQPMKTAKIIKRLIRSGGLYMWGYTVMRVSLQRSLVSHDFTEHICSYRAHPIHLFSPLTRIETSVEVLRGPCLIRFNFT